MTFINVPNNFSDLDDLPRISRAWLSIGQTRTAGVKCWTNTQRSSNLILSKVTFFAKRTF